MKKQILNTIVTVSVLSLLFVRCQDPQVEVVDCDALGATKHSWIPVSGEVDSAITAYGVITPRNYNFCDSFVLYNGTYIEPYKAPKWAGILRLCSEQVAKDALSKGDTSCVCRENADTEWNAKSENMNDYLHIEGIEKYPFNKMWIKSYQDTTKIRVYYDYNNTDDKFVGGVLDKDNVEHINARMLRNGVYEGVLMVYKDQERLELLKDTMKFTFAIIRNTKTANINCLKHAKDKNDNLLLK